MHADAIAVNRNGKIIPPPYFTLLFQQECVSAFETQFSDLGRELAYLGGTSGCARNELYRSMSGFLSSHSSPSHEYKSIPGADCWLRLPLKTTAVTFSLLLGVARQCCLCCCRRPICVCSWAKKSNRYLPDICQDKPLRRGALDHFCFLLWFFLLILSNISDMLCFFQKRNPPCMNCIS